MMKKCFVSLLPALALLFISSIAARADEFSRIQNSPDTYWVPAPTPGYVYQGGPQPYYGYGPYGPPPPGYYGPPPPPVVVPRFFIGFHFH